MKQEILAKKFLEVKAIEKVNGKNVNVNCLPFLNKVSDSDTFFVWECIYYFKQQYNYFY